MPLEAGGIGFGNSSSQTEMKRQRLRCLRTRHSRHLGLRLQDPCRPAQVEKQNPWEAWIFSGQGASADVRLTTGTFPVQSRWSNAFNSNAGGCVLSYP